MTETRTEAQRLVDRGSVEITFSEDVAVYGRVRAERTTHTVTIYHNGHFRCGCKWGNEHPYTNDLCVHALAVKLAMERSRQ